MALTDGLVSYWKQDEASGNALDAHGANELTDNNTVGTAAGKVGNARQYVRASSECFNRADNADLSGGDTDFTIQAWVYLDSKPAASQMRIFDKYPSVAGNQEYALLYYTSGDRFEFAVTSSGSVVGFVDANTFGSPSTGTWYLIHGWHDSVNNLVGIAVNAGTADTATHSAGVRDSASELTVGCRSTDRDFHWDGRLDEIGFWRRVLTADERSQLYNGGAGLAYPFTISGLIDEDLLLCQFAEVW